MADERVFLPVGTTVEFDNGDVYRITGEPIGYGGGSILYPAQKLLQQNGVLQLDGIVYVLKECYPAASDYRCTRAQNGEIIPTYNDTENMLSLQRAQLMHLEEASVSQQIYRTATRMLPIRCSAQSVVLTLPGQPSAAVPNTVTLMDSLSDKGQALTAWIRKKTRFSPAETFRIIQQVLFALQEVHQAGYLHLDIQDGNIFLRGTLEQKNELVTLIDFGCARKLTDGKTAPIRDRLLYTTQGFSAPEILLKNDGSLQLGPEADIYSVGCLTLYLLTGQRANVRELIASRTGVFLRPNQLRRIPCPKHLVDPMQDILTKALAREPENRYHSAAQMLKDVNTLLEALQPQRTNLDTVQYDAFVCYKHGPVDSAAALTIQRALENYRAPKDVAAKRKPFKRVFVDEGELSSCADFGQQIRIALKNSAWLIVVCSPDTPLSPWVKLEIDTFLEYHDRSQILAVLTGGTPETSFPPQLKGNTNGIGEVFAAHALSSTPQEAEQQLKKDALLKIAAPMLHTTYDTLKQRHKVYRLQRLAAVTAGFLLATTGFAAYAANRAKVIAGQAARIEEEYEKALINESLFLAEQAEKKLTANDSLGAAELALQALPSAQQDRPVLAEAEYALGKALGIYKTPSATENTATPVGTIVTDCPYLFLSPDGTKLFAWDDYTAESGSLVECRSTENRDLLWSHSSEHGLSTHPLVTSDGNLILLTYSNICSIDTDTGNVNWTLDLMSSRAIAESEDGARMLVLSGGYDGDVLTASLLSSETGEICGSITLQIPEDRKIQGSLCISPDLRYVAIPATDKELLHDDLYNHHALYLADLETGSCDLILESETEIVQMLFAEDSLFVLRGSGSSFMTQHSVLYSYDAPHTFWLESYSIPEGLQNWSQEIQDYFESNNFYKILPTDYNDGSTAGAGVLYVFEDHAVLMDRISGRMVRQYKLPAAAVMVSLTQKGFETVNTDGTSSITGFGIDTLMNISYFSGEVSEACKVGQNYFLQNTTLLKRDHTIFHYRQNWFDEAYTPQFTADSQSWWICNSNPPEDPDRVLLTDGNRVCLADIRTGEHWIQTIPEEYVFSDYRILGTSADGQQLYWKGNWNFDDPACWIDCIEYYVMDLYSGNIKKLQQPEKPAEYLTSMDTVFDSGKIVTAASWYVEKKSYLSIYVWDTVENTMTELLRYELEPAPAGAEGDALYQWEDYLYGSFVYDRDTKRVTCGVYRNGTETLTKLITADIMTGAVAIIPLSMDAEDGKSVSDCWQTGCSWNDAGTQAAFVYNGSIQIIDLSGKPVGSIPITEPVISLRYLPGGEDLLAVFQNGLLCRYHVQDTVCCASINLADHYTGFYTVSAGRWQWVFPDENTLLAVTDYGGFLIDTAQDSLKMKAQINQCIGYHAPSDRILVAETYSYSGKNTTIGTFPRYSTGDLIQKAYAVLNP